MLLERSDGVKIVTGATAQDGRHVSVELDEADITSVDLSEMSLLQKHKEMMKQGDILITMYFKDAGIFSQDYAVQKLKEIKSR